MLQSLQQTLSVGLVVAAPLLLAPSPAANCPPFENGGTVAGSLEHDAIDESSGLAASRRHPGHFWTHNDSGGQARLFLIDDEGKHVGRLALEGIEATDWEDMAVGPCESGGDESCAYVADIGDNNAERESVSITRVPEPSLANNRPTEWTGDESSTTEFQYPKGPRNAETLMVHPETAELFVVEKTPDAESTVYRIPRQLGESDSDDSSPTTAETVGAIGVTQTIGGLITGGDISPNGREFTVRTYVKVFTFCAAEDEPFASAFETEAVVSHPRFTFQSEAISYGEEGVVWFTSEGKHSALIRMER